ncbi:retention module-containing protein, partial [Chromobacterium amazonense]|uniref:retention module-containing protein n=1 Tax=Chromobacterium amazonense TaxID=1382803 RepID=UPI003F7A9DD3
MAANTTLSGKIGTLKGTVKVIDSQGQEHILKVGDVIHPNDHLIFEQGASLLLNQDGGQQVELSDTKETGAPAAGNAAPQTTTPSDASNPAVPGWNVTTNGQPPQPGQDGNTANANTEAQSVLASLANGQDPLAQLESAAAGLTASGGASANIDHTFIDLTGNTNTAGTLGTGFTPSVGPNATHSTFTSISTAPLNASFTPAPAPPVTLTFNNVGLTNHSEPILQGTGSPGLTVTVSEANGTVLGNTVVGADGSWSLTPSQPLPQGASTLIATSSNNAGQTTQSTATVTVDTISPLTPVIHISQHADGTGSAAISQTDLVNGAVRATVQLDANDLQQQGLASITLIEGGQPTTLTVHSDGSITGQTAGIQASYANGLVTLTIQPARSGTLLQIAASQTDADGNVSSSASDQGIVSTAPPPAPQITIVDHAGTIASGDIHNQQVSVQIALNNPLLQAGTTLTLASNTGAAYNHVLTTADLQNGSLALNIPAAANGQNLTLNAQFTDSIGNPSATSTLTATVNTTPPATPSVAITEHSGQQIASGDVANGQVQATVSLDAGNLANGGSAQISINDGGASSTVSVHSDGSVTSSNPAVSASYAGGVLSLGIPEPANGQQVSVSATQTNALGNVSAAGSASGTLNLTAPAAPTVSITEHAGQQIASGDVANGQVQATVSLDAGNLANGGSAQVSISDGGAASSVTVHSDGSVTSSNPAVSASYVGGVLSLGIPEPANGQQVSVSATQTNALGNVSNAGSAGGTLNLTTPNAPTVSITEHAGQQIASGDVANGQVQATVSLDAGNLANGGSAQVSISDGGASSTVSVHSDGSVTSSNPAVTASYAGGVL